MDTLIQDIRYGLRGLRKSPGFTAVAVLSLGLGIGANTAIFSIVNALMLRSLPVRDPQSLALIGDGRQIGILGGIPGGKVNLLSVAEWQELRRQKHFIQDAAGIFSLELDFRARIGSADSERVKARAVTGNYFSLLGVPAAAGRLFDDKVDQPINTHAEVVLSNGYWQRRFARDPGVVGQTMRIGDRLFTIIGVAAPEFFGTSVGESPDFWVPLSIEAEVPPYLNFYNEKTAQQLHVIVRMQPGVALSQAGAAFTTLVRQLLVAYSGSGLSASDRRDLAKTFVQLTPAASGVSGIRLRFSTPLHVLMGIVVLVLLIATANVANLQLARATAREREMAIRMAVGSSPLRTVRQLLTESLLLSSAGAALGVLFALWGSDLLVRLVSNGHERIPLDVNPDLRVILFTALAAFATGLLFGVVPAFRSARVDVNVGLRDGRGATSNRERMFVSRALVVSQVAISLLLVIGAGLFTRTFANLENIDTGFEQNHVLAFQLDPSAMGYKQDARLGRVYSRIEDRVRQIPGVEAATFAMFAFNQGEMSENVSIEGRPDILTGPRPMVINVTGPQYLQSTGVRLVAGRFFTRQDTAASPKVAVISEQAARDIFGSKYPVGHRMSIGKPEHGHDIEIIGVVSDVKHDTVKDAPYWEMYQPYSQRNEFIQNLLVRTNEAPASVIPAVRQAIRSIEPNLPINEVLTLRTMVDRSLITQHLIAQLSAFFTVLALLLAAVGLYGVLSYSVGRRTSEIGVRIALGAQTNRVLWMVLRETLILVGLGVAIGIPLSLLSSRLVESMLYGLKSNDVLTMLSGTAILLAIGAFAGWLPARRASRVDPMIALRYE